MNSSGLSIPVAQKSFLEIMRNISCQDKMQFLNWIKLNWLKDDNFVSEDSQEEILKCIAADIRSIMPVEGVLPTENISFPKLGENAFMDPRHTVHVDGFLYDDDLVDQLCENGKMSRNYCLTCGSHRTKPLTFISHSASRERLLYIFTALLGPLNEKVILDVGSRLGAILYGAYLYSSSPKIIGIEINKELCELQRSIVQKYGFQDRIEVMEGNLLHFSNVVNASDVVILNNVFEFFVAPEIQILMWQFLRSNVKPGTLLVTSPALSISLQHFKGDSGIAELSQWVTELPPFNPDILGIESLQNEIESVKLYQVT